MLSYADSYLLCREFTRKQRGLKPVRINRMLVLSGPGGIR